MKKKENAALMPKPPAERNEEIAGVLMAISVVSKRLARRLALLEPRQPERRNGGSGGS